MSTELIKIVEEFVKNELRNVDPSHDWNHIKRVYGNAIKIYELEKSSGRFLDADLLVIQLAALMHDVGDFKYTKDHSAGPRMIREFLSQHQSDILTEDKIEKIALIVGNISFRHELSHGMSSSLPTELAIVQDADRLDAIGAAGIARCFAYTGAMKRPFYTDADRTAKTEISAEEYNRQAEVGGGSAVGHFYEKLFKLKDLMKTETGKKMAEERNDFMKLFIDTLKRECEF